MYYPLTKIPIFALFSSFALYKGGYFYYFFPLILPISHYFIISIFPPSFTFIPALPPYKIYLFPPFISYFSPLRVPPRPSTLQFYQNPLKWPLNALNYSRPTEPTPCFLGDTGGALFHHFCLLFLRKIEP